MSVNQAKRKDSGSIPATMPKDKIIKFITDDLSFKAINQINSLVRRREYTKKYALYNKKIREIFLHELNKGSRA